MAEEADLVRLVAQLEANSAKLERDFKKAESVISTFSDKVEKTTDKLKADLEKKFSLMGTSAARSLTRTLESGLAAFAVEKFVSDITEAVENIEKQAKALGLSTDAYQKLAMSARHAGADQESFNTAMDFFSKNLGLAQMKITPFGTLLKRLGVDIHAGPEDALYQFIDAVNKVGNVQQRNALITQGMGRSSVQMAAWIMEGTTAIRAQGDQFAANGQIIDKEAIEKIHQLEVAWQDLKAQLVAVGANVLSGFITSFDQFVKDMGSSNFQSSLKTFGEVMGQVAGYLVKMGPYLPALAGAMAGSRFGPWGALAGGAIGFVAPSVIEGKTLPQAQTDLASAQQRFSVEHSTDAKNRLEHAYSVVWALIQRNIASLPGTAAATKPNLTGGNVDLTGALNKDNSALLEKRKEELDKIGIEAATANSALVTAQDNAAVAMLKGLAGYHDAVLKQIYDERAAKFAVIDEEEKKEIDSLAKLKLSASDYADYKKKIEDTAGTKRQTVVAESAGKMAQIDGTDVMRDAQVEAAKQIQTYKDQTAALGLTVEAVAALTFVQTALNKATADGITLTAEQIAKLLEESKQVGAAAKAASEAQKVSQRSIQVTDELRTGLEDIGAAGLHGFKAMKEAAAQFLDQLAEMILRLYVMKPLVEGLLGPSGTSGGGLVGGGVNDILGALGLGGNFGTGLGTPGFMPGSDPALQAIDGSGGFLDWLGGILGFADGGVMTSRGPMKLRTYSGGGIANSPQVAMYGEGSGPEAYVPLKSGAIPVSLRMPRAPSAQPRGATVVNAPVTVYQSLSGAISPEGVASIARSQAVAVGGQFAKQVRQQFPEMLRTTLRDKA